MYDRDYCTKGAELIRIGGFTGAVSATKDNFNIAAEAMASNEEWRKAIGAQGGVFCLVPWELDIPF